MSNSDTIRNVSENLYNLFEDDDYSSISSSTYYVYIGTYFFSVCVSRLNHVMSHKVGQMMWI